MHVPWLELDMKRVCLSGGVGPLRRLRGLDSQSQLALKGQPIDGNLGRWALDPLSVFQASGVKF